jgi:hypothetical protein
MTLHAGTVTQFGGSMAEAIETAFAAELWALKGATLPDSSAEERHMLFCAIAQGVLGYLKANEADLQVTIDFSSTDTGHVDFDYSAAGT